MGTGRFAHGIVENEDYRRGYLCGMFRGDASIGTYVDPRPKRSSPLYRFRLALCDPQALLRAQDYLLDFEIATQEFLFLAASGNQRAMHGIRTQSSGNVEAIRQLIAWPSAPTQRWRVGFLAGIFDAEGSFSQTVFRISNT